MGAGGQEGHLLFTDMPGNVIWKLTPDGRASVYLTTGRLQRAGGLALGRHPEQRHASATIRSSRNSPMIGADGLTLDRQGRLIVATFAGRSLDAHREERPAHAFWPTATKASASAAQTTSSSSATARSTSQIRTAPSGWATRIRAGSSISTRSSCGRTASSRSSSRTCQPPTASPSRRTKNIST